MTEEYIVKWSDLSMSEKVELIKKVYGQDGGSMGAIAGRVSSHLKQRVSRSAIVGLYTRNPALKITHPFTGVRMPKAVVKTVDELPPSTRKERAPRQKKVKLTPPPSTSIDEGEEIVRCTGEPESRMVPLLELSSQDCRWPTTTAPYRACGHEKMQGSSYCSFHHKRSWEPAPAPRSRTKSLAN